MGFEIQSDIVECLYIKIEEFAGEFHMEDRFDPKTGVKLKQEKVWDKKPKKAHWYEFDGKKYLDIDPEKWEQLLSSKYNCYVEKVGCYMTGEFKYVFHVNKPMSYKESRYEGSATFYNESIDCNEVFALMPEVLKLQEMLAADGYNPGEPRVFLTECIS